MQLQSRQDRADVGKRLVERCRLDASGVKQFRPESIENAMPLLVADDVRTFARVHSPAASRAVKEIQCLAIVIGLNVFAFVVQDEKLVLAKIKSLLKEREQPKKEEK